MKGFAGLCHNNMEQENKPVPENEDVQNAIRQYLLGNLSEKRKMREIEEKLFTDDEFAERLSIAEEELVEEYLDGELTDSEKERFVEFFLAAKENKLKLKLTQNLRKYAARSKKQAAEERSKKKLGFFEWVLLPATMRFAAITLLAAGAVFGFWRIFFYQSDTERGFAQLRAAYRGLRPTESRTTAGFEYASWQNTRGGTQSAADQAALNRAALLFSEAAENPRDAEAHHALGLFYLTEQKPDYALKEFNLALQIAPNNAQFHNDLGALYFEKAKSAEENGKSEEVMANLALALKSTDRALELDPSLLEALFNRALVMQKMQVPGQARQAWQKYLEKDSGSPWAEEARRNLDLLDKSSENLKEKSRILRDFLSASQIGDDAKAWEIVSQTKELITNVMVQPELAVNFLEASKKGEKSEADRLLSAFLYLGELEEKNAGDVYFSELARFYRRSRQTGQLLKAHRELRQAYGLILKPDFKRAIEVLQGAKKSFLDAGDRWEAEVAEYQIAYCLSREDRIEESNERLLKLSRDAERQNHKWLQVLADGWAGETYFFLGEPSKAALYNQKALALAEQISDSYNIHRILVQLMEESRVIGEAERALLFTNRNLTRVDSYYTSARQRWRDLNYAAEVCQRFKYYGAAIVFAEESAAFAENEARDDWMLRTSHRNLAVIYGRLKNFPKAYREAEKTLELSLKFEGEVMRKRLVANSLQTLADLQAEEKNCAPALENYDRAIQSYQELSHVTYEYDARKGRLLCNIAQGNDAGVSEELPVLLKQFDQNREKITNETDRLTFFDAEQEVYDAAVGYAYSKLENTEQAFNYAESSRARSLLNLTSGSRTEPFGLTEVQQKIPVEVQILYYAVLTDRILIWRISRTGINTAIEPIPAEELESRIQKYRGFLTKEKTGDEITRSAKELFRLLISPVAANLAPGQTLCVIADKILFQLPFSSLISPESGKYLIEEHPLLFAPSATLFINETESAAQKESVTNEEVLSVGNPAFSRREYPDLADLVSAKFEAKEIASLYDSAKVLTGSDATKAQVVAHLNEADAVHFAGHYVANSKSPTLSRLLLAGSDLQVGEIAPKALTRVRLLILSACETGVEKFYRGEGMTGAARAFLAAGVPLVVASQWSVESEATAELMIKFHRYRKQQKLPTAAALRQAQIDMLTGEDERFRQPYYWAAFLPIGGYANY